MGFLRLFPDLSSTPFLLAAEFGVFNLFCLKSTSCFRSFIGLKLFNLIQELGKVLVCPDSCCDVFLLRDQPKQIGIFAGVADIHKRPFAIRLFSVQLRLLYIQGELPLFTKMVGTGTLLAESTNYHQLLTKLDEVRIMGMHIHGTPYLPVSAVKILRSCSATSYRFLIKPSQLLVQWHRPSSGRYLTP